MKPFIHVVAGIVYNQRGEILLSSRPEGKPYAGYWEFAGGKIEPNESELDALKREFQEELNICILRATPYLAKLYAYEHATVQLRFYRVLANDWQGKIKALENQDFTWQNPQQPNVSPMLPANAHLLEVLRVPHYFSGSLNTGLYDAANTYPIYPYPADETKHNIAIDFYQLQKLNRLPQNAHVWVIVDNAQAFQAAQDAFGIIWRVQHISSAQQVLHVLQDGTSLPIMIVATANLLAQFTQKWQNNGAHAIIEETMFQAA